MWVLVPIFFQRKERNKNNCIKPAVAKKISVFHQTDVFFITPHTDINLNEAILSAAIRHSSGGWNPGGEPNNPDTGLRRYDVRRFIK